MFHRFAFVVLAFVLTACAGGSRYANAPQAPMPRIEHEMKSTVALLMPNFDKDPDDEETAKQPDHEIFCSGVWISETAILTAGHCAQAAAMFDLLSKTAPEARPLVAMMIDESTLDAVGIKVPYSIDTETPIRAEPLQMRSAVVVAVDKKHDLALIVAYRKDLPPDHIWSHIADLTPVLGEKVSIVGHPGRLAFTYMEGEVSGYRETFGNDEFEGPYLQVHSAIWHGNSGGPIFNASGEVVAIVSFGTSAPGQGFGIAGRSIKHFLIDCSNQRLY